LVSGVCDNKKYLMTERADCAIIYKIPNG